jgi:large subunit ribosomal protein L6
MSRIGKKPILIPEGVEVKLEGQKVLVKGSKGELSREIRPEIKVEVHSVKSSKASAEQFNGVKGNQIFVFPSIKTKQTEAFWGLTRALIANMITGVTTGYEKKLEINGLGFRANLEGKDLVLGVGFTHPVKIICPEAINFSIEKNIITVSGIDKQLVGEISAKIRRIKPPEPYKGKGIKYVDEVIRRKAGKKAVGTTA